MVTDLTKRRLGRDNPAHISGCAFDLKRVTAGIVHLGLGNFHRAHMARYTHDLMAMRADSVGWGIIGVGMRPTDAELIQNLSGQDGLYTLVERDADRDVTTIVGSLVRAVHAAGSSVELLRILDDPSITILSITVTEHGYCLDRATKTLDPMNEAIRHDLRVPNDPVSVIGVVAEAYARRMASASAPFTVLTCDNIQNNGNVVRDAVLAFALRRSALLATWIKKHGCFPNSMVDRITPVPDVAQIAALERRTGIEDRAPVFCEAFRQWIIEDKFAGPRPAWEEVGVQFVAEVAPYEMMKLRLLNCSHLAIAGLGQLMGYETIGQAIADPLIRRYMTALIDRETEPTLLPVPGINLVRYKAQLLERFANPAIRDTVARVNADAPINLLLDPLRDRLHRRQSSPLLSLALAAWLRRARGDDEIGDPAPISHPLAQMLRQRAMEGGSDPKFLLSVSELFGDLGDNPSLLGEVRRWLSSLYESGSRSTLARCATECDF